MGDNTVDVDVAVSSSLRSMLILRAARQCSSMLLCVRVGEWASDCSSSDCAVQSSACGLMLSP